MKNLLGFAPLLAFLVIASLLGIYNLAFFAENSVATLEKEMLLWCASAITFNATVITSIVVSLLVLARFGKAKTLKFNVVLYGLFSTIIIILFSTGLFVQNVETSAGDKILKQLQAIVANLSWVLKVNNRLAWCAGLLMVASAGALAYRSEKANAGELGSRLRYFRAAMYSASALLATGIVEIYQLYRWAEVTVVGKVQSLSAVLPIGASFLFSSFLVAIFLPPAILLDGRYRSLVSQAASASPEFKKENWLLQHDLADSPLRVFSSYLAALLPIISGLLIKIGERIL